jgi:hypothetical protein
MVPCGPLNGANPRGVVREVCAMVPLWRVDRAKLRRAVGRCGVGVSADARTLSAGARREGSQLRRRRGLGELFALLAEPQEVAVVTHRPRCGVQFLTLDAFEHSPYRGLVRR